MDKAQVFVSIGTILVSATMSGLVTFSLNARKESRRIRRQKLEALFRAYNGYVTLLGMWWTPRIGAMRGKISYNRALDISTEHMKDEPRHLEIFEMLVSIYFPHLRSHMEALIALRDRANQVIAVHKESYRQSGPIEDGSADELRAISRDLDALETRFRDAVCKEGRRLNKGFLIAP